ncbi:MAG: carboxypeptidase regulatory-like domain-containing protein, partial [Calditrichaeota bacterium]|nr:carboxypeptidase regulatory-like domain-containing protein [Calditrichota bacterium]
MKSLQLLLLTVLLLFLAAPSITTAQVSVDPIGIAVSMEATDSTGVELTMTNEGDTDVNFKIGFSSPPDDEDQRGAGPRRDQPEGIGILIHNAITGWGNFQLEQYFEAIDDLEYDRFRDWDAVEDVDFDDYDFMWIGNFEPEAWVADYNENLGRIEEFVDGGGALYRPSGTNLHNTRPINPGGLVYSGTQSENDCPLQLDPEENFLINYMNENDPFDWEWGEGQRLHGNGNNHGTFLDDDLEEIENCDWWQVMARGSALNEPIILTYAYGQGYCLVSTTVDGFLHNNPQAYHWGRTGEAVIWYLDFLSIPGWIQPSVDEGVIEADDELSFDLIFMTDEMEEGVYEMIVEIELTEAENRDDLEENMIMITAVMSVGTPVTDLFGEILGVVDDQPIENAKLEITGQYLTRFTNQDGEFSFENIPLGDYEITI